MKKIFAFDIDGTLTHRLDWIDPKVVAMLEGLVAEGWKVILVTGRVFSFAWDVLQYLNFPYLLAVQNGADILEMPEKKQILRQYISAEIIPEIEAAYAGEEGDFILYAGIDEGDFCYYRKERFTPKALDYLKVVESKGAAPWRDSDFQFAEGTSFSLIKCFGTESTMRSVLEKLKTNPNIEVSLIRDPIDRSLFLLLITHPKVNKGAVVHFFREYFGADLVIGAGDDRNDLSLLQESDVAIAIESAPEEILREADIIAKPAKDLGIIEAVKEAIRYAGC